MPKTSAAVVALLLLATVLSAQNEPEKPNAPAVPPPAEAPAARGAKQMLAKYSPAEGTAAAGSYAEMKLGAGWLWLDGAKGRQFLKDCGNQPGSSTLGVAIPPDFADSQAFAVYSYSDEGHVDDAEQPDYDALLADMQESTREESKARQAGGHEGVELLGWAEPPHYDQAQRKLYWATKLRFGGSADLTLNYNVRILGRSGHLVVNGVGGIEQLAQVAAQCKDLLQVTEFKQGQRYTDFDPQYDKLAAYGIGGLIAGKLALKVGLFAKFGLLLVKFIKPILVGVVVLGGLAMKVLTGRKKQDESVRA